MIWIQHLTLKALWGLFFFWLNPKKVNIFHQFLSKLFDDFCSGKFFNLKSLRGSQNLDSLLYRVMTGCPQMLTFPKYWHVPLTKNYHKAGSLWLPQKFLSPIPRRKHAIHNVKNRNNILKILALFRPKLIRTG